MPTFLEDLQVMFETNFAGQGAYFNGLVFDG